MKREVYKSTAVVMFLILLIGAFSVSSSAGGKGKKPPPEPGDPAICYVSTTAQLGNLSVMDADGTHQTAIMGGTMRAAWSHDDTKLVAFAVVQQVSGIYTFNVDGSDPTLIAHRPGSLYPVSDVDWSPVPTPDGQYKILFHKDIGNNGTSDIVVVNIDGSDDVWLTNSSDHYAIGKWSPDSTRILAARLDTTGWTSLVVLEIGVDLNDELEVVSETDITTGGILEDGFYHGFDWEHFQNAIVVSFTGSLAGSFDLYRIDLADPMNPEQLTFTIDVDERFPTVDPTDQKIAFSRSTPLGRYHIYSMNFDGTDLTNLSNLKKGSHDYPRWRRNP